jgi:hypothetical protein
MVYLVPTADIYSAVDSAVAIWQAASGVLESKVASVWGSAASASGREALHDPWHVLHS